jgi:hypothetical protein
MTAWDALSNRSTDQHRALDHCWNKQEANKMVKILSAIDLP